MGLPPAQVNVPQLVALEALWCGAADFGSEDATEGCFCGDAGAFVIKKTDVHPELPHCEWFCSSLALSTGVPQVPFSVVHHTDGNYWFGSKWMNGKTQDWWNLARRGTIDFAALSEDFSRIYALDLFIHNVDRHANNFMVVPDGSSHKVLSFDYSRSWLVLGFPPPNEIMIDADIPTVNVKNWLKANFGNYISVNAANEVLDRIGAIDTASVRRIIDSHPRDWLTQANDDAIISWWDSGMALARVNAIKTGLHNGTLV